jgi:hypothetical protein
LRPTSADSGRRVIVIIDNAKYYHAKRHQAWRAEQSPDFVLDYLPPYSPELNPAERVWKRTRRQGVHDVYCPTLKALIEKVDRQFAAWSKPNDELARLCALSSAKNYVVVFNSTQAVLEWTNGNIDHVFLTPHWSQLR